MRDIIFRAWDKDNNVMHYNLNISTKGISVNDIFNKENSNIVWQQYTGIKDIHNKKIFEGDILRVHMFTQVLGKNMGVSEGETEFLAFINIDTAGVYLLSDENISGAHFNYILMMNGLHEESFEIIGNIYENPELKNKVSNEI